MFNHTNLQLPARADRVVRRVLVTPDMHRVHHSIHCYEHDNKYGFALSIWNRLFGIYMAQPGSGYHDMTAGLKWQAERPSRLGWALKLPFARK